MVGHLRAVLVACAVVSVGIGQPLAPSTLRIAGRVQSYTGAFVSSGKVSVWSAQRQLASGDLDANGGFDLGVPSAPAFELRISAGAHAPSAIVLSEDDLRQPLGDIVLQPVDARQLPLPPYTGI